MVTHPAALRRPWHWPVVFLPGSAVVERVKAIIIHDGRTLDSTPLPEAAEGNAGCSQVYF